MPSAIEVIHSPPSSSSFVPLAEHQAQTPASFYDGPDVLYHHAAGCTVVALKRDLGLLSVLKDIGATDDAGQEEVLKGVDVWVTSRRLHIYFTTLSTGLAIPYTVISLHAIQKVDDPTASGGNEKVQGLYMQLSLTTSDGDAQTNGQQGDEDGDDDMDDIGESVAMTIVPPPAAAKPQETDAATPVNGDASETQSDKSPTEALYAALSACSDLHPDPTPEDDDDDDYGNGDAVPDFPIYNMPPSASLMESELYQAGLVQQGASSGLPPPMPGSGGWITAENAHEFFDEDGNWKGRNGGDENGQGGVATGVKRPGDDVEDGANGDAKWRKTEE